MADLQTLRDAFAVACRATADAVKKALAWAGRQLIRLGEFLLVSARAEEATLLRRIEGLRLAAIQDPATLKPEELLRPGEALRLNISAEDRVGSVAVRLKVALAEARAAVAKARADEARAKLDVLLSADGHCPHRPEMPCGNPMCGHQGCARRHAETRAATYVLKGSATGKSEAPAIFETQLPAGTYTGEAAPLGERFPGEEIYAPIRHIRIECSTGEGYIEAVNGICADIIRSSGGVAEVARTSGIKPIADEVDPFPHLFPGECDPIELAVPLREVVFPASAWTPEVERLVDEIRAIVVAPEGPRPPADQCPSHPEKPCGYPRTCAARGSCALAP